MNAWVGGYERAPDGRGDVMDDIGEAATLLAEEGVRGPAERARGPEDRAGLAESSADHAGRVEGSASESSAGGERPADGSADHAVQGGNPEDGTGQVGDGESPAEDSPHEHSVSAATGVGKQMAALLAPSPHSDRVLAVERNKLFEAMFQVPAEPQRLGRYVVLGTLGKGGMGVVFKAFDPELDRQVALKVLHTELDERHAIRLRREAQAMAKLSHPNVVQVHEVGQAQGQTFVAMELVGGQTLKDWMRQEPRPTWRQCVEVFGQVGAGLAAAHKQGLIHRDFKPGNAIIDDDGRARVLDFGLARQASESLGADPDPDPNPDPDPVPRSVQRSRTKDNQVGPLDVSLTKTGAVLGTPAYMPPEQMKGQPADARSDQFSFCVALYEAVYSERPFEGGTMPALMISMMNGDVRPAPKGSPVPATLRAMLLQGLAVDPDDRWPSMEALLTELQRLLAPRRWRWLGGGLALGLASLGTTLAAPQFVAMQERCSGAQAQLDGIWDDTRRQAVKDAVLGTELSYAEGTWQRIEPKLDDYADAWADKHTEVCEATTIRHEQSVEAMDLRMGCLRERRTALRATVKVLADADADTKTNTKTVENAVRLVTGLPGLARCDDVERLEQQHQRMPPPEDPQVAEAVNQLREQLADIKAMDRAGRYSEALAQVQLVVQQAKALDYGPLLAEARGWQGALLRGDGQYAEAEQELKQVYALALEHEHDQVELDAAQALTGVVGYRLARHDEGLTWGQTALALAKRSDGDLELAMSLNNLGTVFTSLGEYEQAKLHHQRALRIRQKALGPDHPYVAESLNNLGTVFAILGEYEQAKHHHHRALPIVERALGPDHPDVAASLNNLGGVFESLGEYEQAKQHHQRALGIWETALGPDHPYVAASLNNLGGVFNSLGEHEQAKHRFQRALRTLEKALGPDHPDVAASLNNLGLVFNSLGEYEQAKHHFQRALRTLEKALGPDHRYVAFSLSSLGMVLDSLGKHEQAKQHHQRALRIREKALGPDHLDVAKSLGNLGSVFNNLGEYEQAKQHLQRALRIFEKAMGSDHPLVAMSLGNLGNVFKSLGEYEEAKLHHQRALHIWEKALGPDHLDVAYPLVGLAEVALAQHDPTVAQEHAERAVSIREKGSVAPEFLAEARFVLAQTLWSDKSQRPRARDLAEQAREAYAKVGKGQEDDLAEADAWLAKHRIK